MNISEEKLKIFNDILLPKLIEFHKVAIKTGLVNENDLRQVRQQFVRSSRTSDNQLKNKSLIILFTTIIIICTGILFALPSFNSAVAFVLGIRCIVPNNYVVWEATRPIADCSYCRKTNKPLILLNATREQFRPLAYSMQPIIVKQSAQHWPAIQSLSYDFIKSLYLQHPDELNRFNDECQFLSFKSNIQNLKELFSMSVERVSLSGEHHDSWYVGFSNCQTSILRELRKLYPIPHFLPADCELPNTDYIFLGYDQGAIMHLDYIPRLMWQAQLQGNKSWNLAPTPECDRECKPFSFYVESGDIVLIDTRVWYHSTNIANGEFSLTIQSEYG